jgi:hypothetical protein
MDLILWAVNVLIYLLQLVDVVKLIDETIFVYLDEIVLHNLNNYNLGH